MASEPRFHSDNERRVLAWCQPGRCTVESLSNAVVDDPHTAVDEREEVEEILKDLEARGLVEHKDGEWVQTPAAARAFESPDEEQ